MKNLEISLTRAVYHAARLFMGGVFLYASFDKILHPAAFAEAVYNYQILPDAAVNLAALTLPWLLEAVEGRKTILDDRRRLAELMETMPAETCRR